MSILERIAQLIEAGQDRVFITTPTLISGIGTAVAYATGDAFGAKFAIDVPKQGTISNVVFLDLDDEGIAKDLVLFRADIAGTADNAAFDPTDVELLMCVGVISITDFKNFNSNQVGVATPALSYVAPAGQLYGQFVTRGVDNIAAGNIPQFSLTIV